MTLNNKITFVTTMPGAKKQLKHKALILDVIEFDLKQQIIYVSIFKHFKSALKAAVE